MSETAFISTFTRFTRCDRVAKYSKRQREYMKFNKLKRYSAEQRASYWKKKYLRCQKLRGINMKKYRTSSEKRRW